MHEQKHPLKRRPAFKPAPLPPTPPAFPHAARRSLCILAVIACGAVLWAAQDFLLPTITAVVLALVLAPLVKALERFGMPTTAASTIVVIGAAGLIIGGAFVIAPAISDWIARSPEIVRTIERKTQPLREWLSSMQEATDKLAEVTQLSANDGPAPKVVPLPATGNGVLDIAPGLIAQTLYVFVLALFLLSMRTVYRNRIILLPVERENRLRVARIVNETLAQVSSYLFVIAAVNVGVGVVTALAFFMVGVPYAIVWGFVFGVACFIPYLGPIAAITLCALAQLVTADTLAAAAVPPLILLLINLIESNFVTPWLVSRQLAVSALAVFITVALFAWLWGPIASIVAVPVLIMFSAVSRHVPELRPWAVLLMAENQSVFDSKDSKRQKFFAAEDALEAPEPSPWWRRRARATRPDPEAMTGTTIGVPAREASDG